MFVNGELRIDPYDVKLVDPCSISDEAKYRTHHYFDWKNRLCDPFYHEYITPSGDKIVVFGDAEYAC